MPIPNPRYALAMGSSYMGFYAHAGFLAGLEANGIVPGHLAGASSGGVIAGLAASGLGTDEIEAVLMDPWFPKYFLEWTILLRGWGVLLNLPGFGGPVGGAKLEKRLKKVLGCERIEDCPRSLHVAVTNLTEERAEMLTEGELSKFLVATCAMPFVFRPQEIGGSNYWDGGITHDLPIGQWAETDEVETVICHQICWPGEKEALSGKLTIADAFSLSHRTICRDGGKLRHEMLEAAGKSVVQVRSLTPAPKVVLPVNRRREIYRAGFESGVETAEGLLANSKTEAVSQRTPDC